MAFLNEQPGERNTITNEMLITIRRNAAIIAKPAKKDDKDDDDAFIGRALTLQLRRDEIDPAFKQYASYIEVWRPNMGNNAYVPTDFIASIDDDGNTVRLTVDEAAFVKAMWDIAPDFIVGQKSEEKSLASATITLLGDPIASA